MLEPGAPKPCILMQQCRIDTVPVKNIYMPVEYFYPARRLVVFWRQHKHSHGILLLVNWRATRPYLLPAPLTVFNHQLKSGHYQGWK
jgi:hypothetical protein